MSLSLLFSIEVVSEETEFGRVPDVSGWDSPRETMTRLGTMKGVVSEGMSDCRNDKEVQHIARRWSLGNVAERERRNLKEGLTHAKKKGDHGYDTYS